jgi:hypothetical protein
MVADLLMSSMVVDHLAIVQWIFSEHSASLLTYNPWEILHMAFGKTVSRTEVCNVLLRVSLSVLSWLFYNAFVFVQFLRAQNHAAKLEAQLREEKDLFLTTFQRFVIVLESYLASSGAAAGAENAWFRSVIAQMRAFARRYRNSIHSFKTTLVAIVFSDDCDVRIRTAFMDATA